MTLLRHGGCTPPGVAGDVPDAYFGTQLLDHQDQCRRSVAGHLRHLLITHHGSDVGHSRIFLRTGRRDPAASPSGTCIETVNFLCKELA